MSDIQFLPEEELKPEFVVASLSETQDWGLINSHIPDAHKVTKGTGVVVAVLDTGYSEHIDLDANVIGKHNFAGTQTAEDFQGHGTHVAGIIAALENDNGVIGVAPEAKVHTIKVLDNAGRGNFDAIANGIRCAIDLKVDIISMSLGSPQEPPPHVRQAIVDATNAGIIVIAAAGNDSQAVNWPARYDEVIAVAAVDQDGKMARFSSRGGELDVAGPGVEVYSTYKNNGYALLNGTSQAAPFIAGVAALILSHTRSNPTSPQIGGTVDMLKALGALCNEQGQLVKGELGYGIPDFANVDWKNL